MTELMAVHAGPETHPLRASMDAYNWLLLRLIPIFGTDRILLADADGGHSLGIGVHNGQSGDTTRRHAMWLERETATERYSLNALPEERRDTVVRHFIQDAKTHLGWNV